MFNINQMYKHAFRLKEKLGPKTMLASFKDENGLECLYMDLINGFSHHIYYDGFSCNVFSAQQGNKFIGWLTYREGTGFSFNHVEDEKLNQRYLNLICGIWEEKE